MLDFYTFKPKKIYLMLLILYNMISSKNCLYNIKYHQVVHLFKTFGVDICQEEKYLFWTNFANVIDISKLVQLVATKLFCPTTKGTKKKINYTAPTELFYVRSSFLFESISQIH